MSIYVIDDHPLMRDAIVMVLRRLRPAENIVELERLDKLASSVQQRGAPTLFCLDLKLPDTNGVSGVIAVKQVYPNVPIAVYSAAPAADMEDACIEAGADTYIEKSASSNELAAALRGLLMAGSEEADEPPLASSKLSKRQTQLIAMLDKGMSNRDIATDLEISEHTVKVHLWRLFRRLGVKSRTQALHYARTNGLLSG
ncbi:DNA-binding NarL/FixJ family response regulator [Variovorax boronicumulans]|uniref:DNA-binding NarL/FixJ family response regulator n=2 Tax=Variovorax TaxID=34072 RepID=A0AAW8D2E3_9BURK|nr:MULTISPECIES: response regulator transcription factor [Variovorax]ADU38827.1 two component transcriptional regulator, LuxR family [Variovorax paradoxus EPS]MBJ2155792.1 response regulator transcription factor [Variovorax sp. IB41]MDH6166732.1 DNA-binding NarL/FixJ family response regulator [Variovorax boronicumulans]MDP9894153.1 DNA-binding NarL/FixJ family response regulator [Variovorax boronicumulans]MDP9990099.1 DNA-binding NarL/FixJ family response regulator [Variovorax boronicumulans]